MRHFLLIFTIIIICFPTFQTLQASGNNCIGNANFDFCEDLRALTVQFYYTGDNEFLEGNGFLGWDFGDGSFDWENENPYHKFPSEGYYYVCAFNESRTWDESYYCWNNYCQFIYVDYDSANQISEEKIEYSFEGNQFHFETTMDTTNKSWYWSFEEEEISTNLKPVHVFKTPGEHEVRFTSIDKTTCKEEQINTKVDIPQNLEVCEVRFDFEVEGNVIQFTSKNIGYPTNVAWDFGMGETSIELNPKHTFRDTRTSREVCLTIKDAYQNCEKTHCRTIDFQKQGFCRAKFEAVLSEDSLSYFLNDISEYEGEIAEKSFFYKSNYRENGRIPSSVPSTLLINNSIYSEFGKAVYKEVCLEIVLENGVEDISCQTIFFPKKNSSEQPEPNNCGFRYFVATDLDLRSGFNGARSTGTFFHDYSEPENVYAFFLYSQFFEDWTWIFEDGTTSKAAKLTKQFDTEGIQKICLEAKQGGVTCTECKYFQGKEIIQIEEETTSIEDFKEKIHWDIFPNPSTKILNIDFQNFEQPLQKIVLRDYQGKIVYQSERQALNKNDKPFQVALTEFKKGLYFIQLVGKSQTFSKRFVKIE